jgi:dynein heavy chain
VFGSPKETLDLIEKREKDLEKDKMKFFEEMKV